MVVYWWVYIWWVVSLYLVSLYWCVLVNLYWWVYIDQSILVSLYSWVYIGESIFFRIFSEFRESHLRTFFLLNRLHPCLRSQSVDRNFFSNEEARFKHARYFCAEVFFQKFHNQINWNPFKRKIVHSYRYYTQYIFSINVSVSDSQVAWWFC